MIKKILTALALVSVLASNAFAAEYTVESSSPFVMGEPTSIAVTVEDDGFNETMVDRSKNSALIPPAFGSKTADLRGSGEPLTPNLASPYIEKPDSVLVTYSSATVPPLDSSFSTDVYLPGIDGTSGGLYYGNEIFTPVTEDMYYPAGYLGKIEIPVIGVTARIYEGTTNDMLAKGAGHFVDTSIWNGNVCIAAHNRGTNAYFGDIHTLKSGDEIILTTKRGTRTYRVFNVEKISVNDTSNLQATRDNIITLITCVRGQADYYRWCVQASAIN